MDDSTKPVLLLDHAGRSCSVSVVRSDGTVLAERIQPEPQRQAEDLARMVQECLGECRLETIDLRAIACQRGPGSYTGLRIGASLAQGMALPYNLPLVGVGTLECMAYAYFQGLKALAPNSLTEPLWYVPLIDARRDEYYVGVYSMDGKDPSGFPLLRVDQEAQSWVPDENFLKKIQDQRVCFLGDGVPKWHDTLSKSGYLDIWKQAEFVYDFSVVSSNWYGLVANYLSRGEAHAPASMLVDYRKPFFGTTLV
ncbi:MAG: tRNA (adenosine(37)-N6)-threonylcarbamoyltransferase complex dimerization subunit type 1 TsaB [Bacteroidota bacterium]